MSTFLLTNKKLGLIFLFFGVKNEPQFRLGFLLKLFKPNKLTNMKSKILLLTLLLTFSVVNVFSQTVYITKTGTKYHTDGCRYLSQSKIAIELSDAIAKGYGACSVCKPATEISRSTTTNTTSPKTEVKSPTSQSTNTMSQSVSVQCSATTKAGTRCKRMTKSSNGKCWQHGGN